MQNSVNQNKHGKKADVVQFCESDPADELVYHVSQLYSKKISAPSIEEIYSSI